MIPSAILTLVKRGLPYVLAVLVVGAVLYGAYHHGVSVTATRYELQLANERTANAEALAKAQADVRGRELAAAQTQAAIVTDYEKRQADAKTVSDRTIAGLRDGTVRLRSELASAQCAIAGVSDIATGTAKRDAACTGGLRADDAAFLVRFADRADAVARQLEAAQAVIVADRKVCGPHDAGGAP